MYVIILYMMDYVCNNIIYDGLCTYVLVCEVCFLKTLKQKMRGQTKAQVENHSRETADTGVTNMCLRQLN